MIYVDANVFIHAIKNRGMLGDKARKYLRDIQEGKEKAATSALTFDEVVWKILQSDSFDDTLLVATGLINMPNLILLNVDKAVLSKSIDLMKLYGIYPRDSIHAACALNNNIFTIISEDKDFDDIKELKRKSINELRF